MVGRSGNNHPRSQWWFKGAGCWNRYCLRRFAHKSTNKNRVLTTFMLKKRDFILRLCWQSLSGQSFVSQKITERNERWTVSPLKKSRANSVLPGRPFFCICRIIPHWMMRFLFLAISHSIRGLCKEWSGKRFSYFIVFLFHALLNVNTDLRILNCRRFARKSINKNHVLTTFMLKKRGFILFLSR